MVQVHTDRLPIDQDEVAELAERIFGSIENAPNDVHIWESDQSHYHGRDGNNEVHIGLNIDRLRDEESHDFPLLEEDNEDDERDFSVEDETRYVIAHEFGHDLVEKDYEDNNQINAREHVDEDGKLDAGAGMEQAMKNDPKVSVTRMVTSEMLAELAAEETSPITDPYDRHPYPGEGERVTGQVADMTTRDFFARNASRVDQVAAAVDDLEDEELDYLTQLPKGEFDQGKSVFKSSYTGEEYGIEAYVEKRGAMERLSSYQRDDMDAIRYRLDLLANLREGYQRDDIDMTEVIRNAWAQDARYGGEYGETPFFEAVDQYLDVDYDELDSSDYVTIGSTVADEAIEEHRDDILRQVVEESVEEIRERVENVRETYGDVIANPDGMLDFPRTSEMVDWLNQDQEVYMQADYDFSHKIGCTIGRILHDRDITLDEVTQDMDTYMTIANEAVEEVMQTGYQNHVADVETPTMEDFEAATRYIIDKHVDQDTYSRETDYRSS